MFCICIDSVANCFCFKFIFAFPFDFAIVCLFNEKIEIEKLKSEVVIFEYSVLFLFVYFIIESTMCISLFIEVFVCTSMLCSTFYEVYVLFGCFVHHKLLVTCI